MKRTSLLVALFVVVGTLVVPVAGVLAQETEDEPDGADVKPGERLSGVVGVQSAEIDGEIERNAFRIGLERADDNATKARHIAEKLNETETRLAALEERKAELQAQRERGEITDGQYRARTARLATEVETARQQLNQSNATAADIPGETLERNNVNTTAIRTLMRDADQLRGGEVSEIARSIAGNRSGMVERGPRGDRGPDTGPGPGDERAPDTGPGPGDERGPGDRDTTEDGKTIEITRND
ncbi:hypothetical protein [Natronomonas sp. LN261]|uniref:hypothetical protein n=1 Tax=Natronomonas sp. LN261 TaxID=2750669 RepID=UPI0015EEE6AF|nr:hypothetical protein [Natronomonas sp. LN261]